jgi:predicted transcriptional regulator
MKRITRAESIIKRQQILDACKDKPLIIAEISEAIGMVKTQLNHHLVNLVAAGYLSKNQCPTPIHGQWGYNYKTINFEPYEWSTYVEVEEKPVTCEVNFDQKLMFLMGYTNIQPPKGEIYRALI